jgi:hypothetical protein
MYAWCVAVHKNGVRLTHELPPASRLMAQPPQDWVQGQAAFLHYTWGTLYHQDGKEIWRFDKRDWTAKEHELKVRQVAAWTAGLAEICSKLLTTLVLLPATSLLQSLPLHLYRR